MLFECRHILSEDLHIICFGFLVNIGRITVIVHILYNFNVFDLILLLLWSFLYIFSCLFSSIIYTLGKQFVSIVILFIYISILTAIWFSYMLLVASWIPCELYIELPLLPVWTWDKIELLGYVLFNDVMLLYVYFYQYVLGSLINFLVVFNILAAG